MVTESSEGFGEYKRLILQTLEQQSKDLGDIRRELERFRQTEVADMKVEIALLKLKSSLWGALMGSAAGAVVTIGALLLKLPK